MLPCRCCFFACRFLARCRPPRAFLIRCRHDDTLDYARVIAVDAVTLACRHMPFIFDAIHYDTVDAVDCRMPAGACRWLLYAARRTCRALFLICAIVCATLRLRIMPAEYYACARYAA